MFVDDYGKESSSSTSRGGGKGTRKVLYVPRLGLDFDNCNMDMIRCDAAGTTSSVVGGGGISTTTTTTTVAFYDDWPKNRWGIPEPP